MIFGSKQLKFRSHSALLHLFDDVGIRRTFSIGAVEDRLFNCVALELILCQLVAVKVIYVLDDSLAFIF